MGAALLWHRPRIAPLRGSEGAFAGEVLVGPQEWRQRKKGFVTRALSTPNPHKPYLAILQVLKDVHELRQGFDARVSAVEGILPKYVPQLYHQGMFKNVMMNAWLKTIKLLCLEYMLFISSKSNVTGAVKG